MRKLLDELRGRRLDLQEYDSDFYRMAEHVHEPILKTERIQTFREPGSPSWEAFAEGRWQEALTTAARPDEEFATFLRHLKAVGSGLHRLRVAELPLTPYLQWELHVLLHRSHAGEDVKVLLAQKIRTIEAEWGPLPELMILGDTLMYEVVYENGLATGAVRFDEADAVALCREHVLGLFDESEDIEVFFDREVRSLPAPRP
jgi:hypothetical protein